MFYSSTSGHSWTFDVSNYKKQGELVNAGCWVIEHGPTGRLVIGASATVSKHLESILAGLAMGHHPVKRFEKLCRAECVFRVYVYPCSSLKHANQLSKTIVKTVTPAYLLLN